MSKCVFGPIVFDDNSLRITVIRRGGAGEENVALKKTLRKGETK